MTKSFYAFFFFLFIVPPFLNAETPATSIDVDASVTLNSFRPISIFGNNTNGWASPVPVKDKIQGAGNFLLRYPGGSWGDAFYWNGNGDYDANGDWVPSDTDYGNSRMMKDNGQLYDAPKAIDGDKTTAWRSNVETDYPHGQWMYMDFQSQKPVDKVSITWGNAANKAWPFAKKFTIQYWDAKESRQWMPYGAERNAWLDTSAVSVTGKGGFQEVSFQPVTTQYLRVLMTESTAGENGTYSIAEIQAFMEKEALPLKSNNCIVASSTNTASELGDRKIFGFEEYMDFMQSLDPPGIPLIIVNMGSGTPKLAAAWVKYANITRKYGIKYWEIGNENGGQWEAGGPINVRDYARRYILFYEAMKAVDPTITLVAQVGFSDPSGVYDGVLCLKDFVDRLAQDKKEKYVDAISIHQYPNWGQAKADLLASPKSGMDDMDSSIKTQFAAYPALANIPIWITEFNTSDHVKPNDISVHLENGLWLAQYLAEFICHFGNRGYTLMWDVLNGGSAINDPTGGDHGYMQAEGGPYQYQERADYWTMKMMTNDWSKPGDNQVHQMVDAQSPEAFLAVYADYRPDGKLGLLVVNKSPDNAYKAAINLKDFKAKPKTKGWSFDKTNYNWETETPPYHADPDEPPKSFTLEGGPQGFDHVFPAYSITVLQFVPEKP